MIVHRLVIKALKTSFKHHEIFPNHLLLSIQAFVVAVLSLLTFSNFCQVTIVKSALMVGMVTLLIEHPRTVARARVPGDQMLWISLPEHVYFPMMVCRPVKTAQRVTREGTVRDAWTATLDGRGWVVQHIFSLSAFLTTWIRWCLMAFSLVLRFLWWSADEIAFFAASELRLTLFLYFQATLHFTSYATALNK